MVLLKKDTYLYIIHVRNGTEKLTAFIKQKQQIRKVIEIKIQTTTEHCSVLAYEERSHGFLPSEYERTFLG